MPHFRGSGTFVRMKVRVLERTQTVPRSQEETFGFFADPRNLKRLTPPFLQFKFLSNPPKVLQPGAALDYQIRLYGDRGPLADANRGRRGAELVCRRSGERPLRVVATSPHLQGPRRGQ